MPTQNKTSDMDKKLKSNKREVIKSAEDMKHQKKKDFDEFEDEEAQPKRKKNKARNVEDIEVELVEQKKKKKGKGKAKKGETDSDWEDGYAYKSIYLSIIDSVMTLTFKNSNYNSNI